MAIHRLKPGSLGAIAVTLAFLAAPAALSQKAPKEDLHLAIKALLETHNNVVRLGIQAVEGTDTATAQRLELELIQLATDAGFNVLTPEKVKQQLAKAQETVQNINANHLWADHILLSNATTTGTKMLLTLRLVEVKTGQTIAQVDAFAGKSRKQSSLSAETLRGAVAQIADKLHYDIGRLPGDTRYQRIAVMPLEENGTAAQNLALGSFLQQEIGTELRERGFLSVERSQLKKAIAQIGLAQALSAENAPSTGKMLGAQVLVVGAVSEAGQHFVVTGRAIDAQSGNVLGNAMVQAKRENIVTLASGAIETRNTGGAVFRSILAPGWGQFYFMQPVRGTAWAVATYGTLAIALGTAAAGYQQERAYAAFTPDENADNNTIQQELATRRAQANNLYTTAAIAGGAAGFLWTANIIDAIMVASDAE